MLAIFWKFLSVAWNVLSPVRALLVSSYADFNTVSSVVSTVQWTTVLDAPFVTSLYENASVLPDMPNEPSRFVNVYIDLIVQAKATAWAPFVNDLHRDPMVGRYCRSGLRPKTQAQRDALIVFDHMNLTDWGLNVHEFIADQEDCSVNEVTEAIICVKGLNASRLVNLEWSTKIPPSASKLAPGLRIWQELLTPDLDACLARRQALVVQASQADRVVEHPLVQLTKEIAFNYSLDLHGFASRAQLYSEFRDEQGFVDISGKRSGVRQTRLTGYILENVEFETPSALTAARQSMWDCSKLTSADTVSSCFRDRTLAGPAFFLGHYRTFGRLTEYRYLNFTRAHQFPSHRMVSENLFVSTDDVLDQYTAALWPLLSQRVRAIPNTAITEALGDAIVCVSDQRCLQECIEESTVQTQLQNSSGWKLGYRQSEKCVFKSIDPEFFAHGGYVSQECFGISFQDTGALQVVMAPSILRSLNLSMADWLVNGTADPNAVLACMLGGRIPHHQEGFPVYFIELIRSGTQTVLVSTFTNGSEKMFLNFLALVSLGGCTAFAGWTILETWSVWNLLNISARAWRRHRSHMVLSGFISLVSWYVGTTQTQCAWRMQISNATEIANLTVSTSTYRCFAGDAWAPIRSLWELTRLLAFSHVFYCIVFHEVTVGIEQYTGAIVLCSVCLGAAPNLITSVIITVINRWRLQSPRFSSLHNSIVLAVMWATALLVWCQWLRKPYSQMVFRLFAKVGYHQQPVLRRTMASYLVGSSYFTSRSGYHVTPNEWLPLSVVLELPNTAMAFIDTLNNEYTLDRELNRPCLLPPGCIMLRSATAAPTHALVPRQEFFVSCESKRQPLR
ncbi:TPA: hypothetical protein N0F65_008275 [Lagenidium giganteum]|uniref:Uncharacterized protein n=1 Tax=Lagenidium giganteum TaxID=4803 RepID=A0AAV2YUD1_9STRA|nr:TPA: hypothetical protein N0F65_008275 [Lagenidium giganteum]